jgi:hypothetical protein
VAEVKGLALFRDRFAAHKEKYFLIGGCALHTTLSEAGQAARATKDLDIVLVVEAIDQTFVELFWQFVEEGGYEIRQEGNGEARNFYRFKKPTIPEFPAMLELFSRSAALSRPLAQGSTITPIPVAEEVESLSAILLDDEYYEFILARRRTLLGLPYISEECLIPLKALAWLDLRERKANGAQVDSKDIKKHLTDVFALTNLLTPGVSFNVSPRIAEDIRRFTIQAREENPSMERYGKTAVLEDFLLRIEAAFAAA